jgi:6-phosphogluconolactonase/glucosamine-6-phosphate isomerase/deaminase
MKLREFDTFGQMEKEAVHLLREHFRCHRAQPHAVMLTGGKTPLSVYRILEKSRERVDAFLHLLISDERYVPLESPQSNYGNIRPMVHALGVDESRVMRVHTYLPLDDAADRYDAVLSTYIEKGGRITLGFLGLGADGHVASLFTRQDLTRWPERYAIAVPRETVPDRVSVTRKLLLRIESLVFLVAGQEKAAVLEKILNDPISTVAGQAVRGIAQTELWYSHASPDALV